MLRYRNVIFAVLTAVLLPACAPQPPHTTQPAVVNHHAAVGYQITLLHDNPSENKVYRIRKADLLEEDVLHQKIRFRTETGETISYHGSWRKEDID